jgi:hypothetical protein
LLYAQVIFGVKRAPPIAKLLDVKHLAPHLTRSNYFIQLPMRLKMFHHMAETKLLFLLGFLFYSIAHGTAPVSKSPVFQYKHIQPTQKALSSGKSCVLELQKRLLASSDSKGDSQVDSKVDSKIVQLTHPDEHYPIADPTVVYGEDGKIRVYGTTDGTYLEYGSEDAFLHNRDAIRKKFQFAHPDGTPFNGDEIPWDMIPLNWTINGKETRVYYAGAMTPPLGDKHAHWPADNPSRRTYAFMEDPQKPGVLIRSKNPVIPNPDGSSSPYQFIGHNYGRDFLKGLDGKIVRDADGSVIMYYERVGRYTANGNPITEIAARKMSNPFHADGEEIVLLSVDENNPWKTAKRGDGGLLLEGPRVVTIKVKDKIYYVMGFSAGDFPTEQYGIHFAVSENPLGPFHPILTDDKKDLKDFGAAIRKQKNLYGGPARPDLFMAHDGQWWVAFHAAVKRGGPNTNYKIWPESLDDFHRNIYLTPFEIGAGKNNLPKFELMK